MCGEIEEKYLGNLPVRESLGHLATSFQAVFFIARTTREFLWNLPEFYKSVHTIYFPRDFSPHMVFLLKHLSQWHMVAKTHQ